MKKKIGLRLKFIVALLIFAVIITVAAILVGVQVYKSATTEQYNTTAYQVARTAATFFNEDEIQQWADLSYRYVRGQAKKEEVEKVTNSKRYQEVKQLLNNLRKKMEANDIFSFNLDMETLKKYAKENKGNPICYVTDSYHVEEQQFNFGDSSGILPEFVSMTEEAYEGKEPTDYMISEGTFGYNVTAVYPIVKDGKSVAFIGVEMPMVTLQKNINTFVTRVILISGITVIVLLVIITYLLIRIMINPIKLIASEASKFVQDNNVVSKELGKIKSNDEIRLLSESLLKLENEVNAYIENITAITAEKERIGAELNVATQIQADMLPSVFPAFPERDEFDIYATMNPAKEVGGDFYDFFLIDEDHLAMTIADVSGKGVPAALFMMISKTLLKNQAAFNSMPATVLEIVNNQLCENNKAEMFVTVWFSIMEISTGKVVAANAGHEYPAIRKADGDFELLKDKHGFVLAGMEDVRYQQYEFEIEPGGTLYVYTDGVPEATNADNQLFGTDRMLEALNQKPDASPEELLATVKQAIDGFVQDAPQFDDITMLSLKRIK